jgi:hypothetical protein
MIYKFLTKVLYSSAISIIALPFCVLSSDMFMSEKTIDALKDLYHISLSIPSDILITSAVQRVDVFTSNELDDKSKFPEYSRLPPAAGQFALYEVMQTYEKHKQPGVRSSLEPVVTDAYLLLEYYDYLPYKKKYLPSLTLRIYGGSWSGTGVLLYKGLSIFGGESEFKESPFFHWPSELPPSGGTNLSVKYLSYFQDYERLVQSKHLSKFHLELAELIPCCEFNKLQRVNVTSTLSYPPGGSYDKLVTSLHVPMRGLVCAQSKMQTSSGVGSTTIKYRLLNCGRLTPRLAKEIQLSGDILSHEIELWNSLYDGENRGTSNKEAEIEGALKKRRLQSEEGRK